MTRSCVFDYSQTCDGCQYFNIYLSISLLGAGTIPVTGEN